MIYKELIRTGLDLKNSDEAIELLAGLLLKGGYVKDGFREAVMEREKKFPTGLSTGDSGFAIPHTDTAHVKKAAVAIGILKHPVRFGEMGDAKNTVDVDIVVMLAIQKQESVVPFLKDLCSLFQDRTLVNSLHSCSTPEEVANILKPRLNV